jgi:hypothetical protein
MHILEVTSAAQSHVNREYFIIGFELGVRSLASIMLTKA